MPKPAIIFIPGLGDGTTILKIPKIIFEYFGYDVFIHQIGWRDGSTDLDAKLNKLTDLIDGLHKSDYRIALIGISAGASAALNAFVMRKDLIHRVVNVCGRLRVGPLIGMRSFDTKTKSSPAFATSVKLCEENLDGLSDNDKKSIMTIQAFFGDQLVPPDTVSIAGSYNIWIPSAEHMFTIFLALTVFSGRIRNFLKQK